MKIIKIVSLFLFMAIFTACLKSTDNNFVNSGLTGTGKAVSFVNMTGTGPYGYNINNTISQTIGAVYSTTPATFVFYVQLTSDDGTYPGTTVSIDKNTSQLTQYNSDNGTTYSELPDSVYSFANKTATIDPVTHIATYNMQLISSKIDLSQSYALALSVVSVSNSAVGIPANTTTKVLIVNIKNAYDANYTVTGYFYHPTAASCRAISMTKSLTTVDPISCSGGLADLEKSYGYRFQFSVDQVTNNLNSWVALNGAPAVPQSGFMTADNPGANNPNYTPNLGFISKTYNNTYVPASSTFWMHFGYASGGNGQKTWTRQIYEKWVRQ